MNRPAALLLAASATLCAAPKVNSWKRQGNVVLFELEAGRAEIEIVNASTFRFLRCADAACVGRAGAAEPGEFEVSESPLAVKMRTSYLDVEVRKGDCAVSVRSRRGAQLLEEIVRAAHAGLVFDRVSPPGERLYGLGPRTDRDLNLRGKLINTSRPLLISSLGFGQYFPAATNFQFDLARAVSDRVQVRAPFASSLEYFFYYGPSPREVLEEHAAIVPVSVSPRFEDTAVLAVSTLPRHAARVPAMPWPDLLAWLSQGAMSGAPLTPAIDLAAAASPLAQILPVVYGGEAPERARLRPYLYTYLVEARDRGFPMIHPMPMQFPNDAECSRHTDQFMLGDELLAAAGESVYLPMGMWTDLRTNAEYRGRQTIPVPKAPGLPLFARNGSIVPLLRPDGVMELHYFPKLGAEFFIAEPGEESPSQVHAGPAGDVLRLEIESRVDRTYEWVIHQGGGTEGLRRVRVEAKAGADHIVNLQ